MNKCTLLLLVSWAALLANAQNDPLCSPGFFWIWNARLEPAKLIAQLEDMHAHGMRNVCAHPFPREFRTQACASEMSPDYLSEAYLAVVGRVAKRAQELGMHFYLYDEGGWPSGSAAGRVAASDVEGRFCQTVIGFGLEGQDSFGVYRRPYVGATPYPSLIEKGMTERFVALTHDRIAHAVGSVCGRAMKVAFTDEPQHPTSVPGRYLGWSTDFAEVFKAKKGYDLVPHVPEMLRRWDETDAQLAKWRIDYRDVMGDLFVERYLNVLSSWCRGHGMFSGGHLNGEDVPEKTSLYGHGNLLRSLRAMEVPGVDAIWRQIFPCTGSMRGGMLWLSPPFPRYAASMAHQCGRAHALSETFCIYGDGCSPVEMKWIVDQQIVRGINTFVFGYSVVSNAKKWTIHFEPHFGPIAPTWDMMPHWFRYIENTCAYLSQGRPGAEVVVLYDVRGFWAGGADCESAAWSHYAAAKTLDRMNVDYDFTDDESIARAEVTADGLRIGAMTYRTVVLPSEKWMLPAAKEKLAAFERAGGHVARAGDFSSVPRTLTISGTGAGDVTVMKRVVGKRNIYLLFNENTDVNLVNVTFPEGGRIVRHDPADGRDEVISEDGRFSRILRGGETMICLAGDVPAASRAPEMNEEAALALSEGWTIQRLVSHEATEDDLVIRPCNEPARETALGDWRAQLGSTFSGKAVYRTTFECPKDGWVTLSLGKVRWCAAVKLNGREIGARFYPPFDWNVEVRRGTNVLEVTVANLLANQIGDETIRRRLSEKFPPSSNYDAKQRPYDRDNHDAGLFGPVQVKWLMNH